MWQFAKVSGLPHFYRKTYFYSYFRDGREYFDIKDIREFKSKYQDELYWHICFGDGSVMLQKRLKDCRILPQSEEVCRCV